MVFYQPPFGIDFLLADKAFLHMLSQKRVGLVSNQNTLTRDYKLSAHAIKEKLGSALTCILTPEHGWSGQIAEGVKIGDGVDSHLKVPIFSLYGGAKSFLQERNFDTLIIDLQDVGLRCYTYVASCAKLLESLSDVEVVICDRPNPLGLQQRGPSLDPSYRSFLAYLDVSFQHGKTLGELLSNYNKIRNNLPLTVISCQRSHQPYRYPWIPPSPNLPTWESVLLYPALVLLEGTTISEGRGTSLPFTCLGAPELDHYALVEFLNTSPGIQARPLVFTPQAGQFKGKKCHGAHLLITDYKRLEAFSLGLELLSFLKEKYPRFQWVQTEQKKYFIDLLLGCASFRKSLEDTLSLK